jgi:hypothetical protein
LNSATPFTATPIGPSGVSLGDASCGETGIRSTRFCEAIRFGLTCMPGWGASYCGWPTPK